MIKNFKKFGIIFLITLVVLRTTFPVAIFADDPTTPTPTDDSTTVQQQPTDTPTDSPAPTDSPTPTPTDAPTDTTTPTPTDSPTPTPDPSVDPSIATDSAIASPSADDSQVTNNAGVTNDASSNSNTGGNDSSSATGSSGTTSTGDAASTVEAENNVNTTSVNSEIYYQTINIYENQDGDLDLSVPTEIVNDLIKNKDLTSDAINVSMIDNSAYVINNISATSNTGDNSGGDIDTGNSYSIISLLNKVNMTVVNSHIHIVTINIFGSLNGNIMLPVLSTDSQNCALCGITQSLSNDASLNNNISDSSNTGENTASSSATIQTGDAISLLNLFSVVNTSYVNVDAESLLVNNFGDWTGTFLGFTDNNPVITENGLTDSNLSTLSSLINGCGCASSLLLNNNANVQNNLTATSNSGGNSGNNIHTGNAFSVISLFNFINATFINSNSFFGFINIFGKLNGSIGRVDLFPPNNQVVADSNTSSDQNQEESGGALYVSNSNNTGAYVLPGDTVTFFIKVKNTGTGKIYHAKLDLSLLKGGGDMGGGSFDLGDIPAGHEVDLSTGLVLGDKTLGGQYVGHAYVTGETGDEGIDGAADSSLTIKGFLSGNTIINIPQVPSNVKVLASNNNKSDVQSATSKNNPSYISLIILIFGLYLLMEKSKKDTQMLFSAPKNNKKKSSKTKKRLN